MNPLKPFLDVKKQLKELNFKNFDLMQMNQHLKTVEEIKSQNKLIIQNQFKIIKLLDGVNKE